MADEETTTIEETETGEQVEESTGTDLQGGAYEVLRKRLLGLNKDLCIRLEQVNTRRKEVFGGKESQIIGTERIQTENNCIPRDITGVGDHLIFGYNVFLGLKSGTKVSDVFSVHKFDGTTFAPPDRDLLGGEEFVKDFGELYRYYKNAKFLQFVKTPVRLFIIFQIGETTGDIRIFRFRVTNDDNLEYIDDRGDLEYTLPPEFDFEWRATTRDNQVQGLHPHISVLDRLFVECIGGDLTIKMENNTETGEGVYSEPVENPDQTLDDAAISYATVGSLILLRIRPYREETTRYFVFNERTQSAVRLDSIGQACVQLPEDHGIIFPKGYYLQDGVMRQFDEDVSGMVYLECTKSPNGEDFLYIFYHKEQGRHVLLQYNLISKQLTNPISCHGYSLYDDGRMVLFTAPDSEPRRNHPMQVWQTPFYGDKFEVAQESDSYLKNIGNRDLVRGISEGYAISRLITRDQVDLIVYHDIARSASALLDGYHWLGHAEAGNIQEVVQTVRATANAAVDEFEKVQRIRQNTERQIRENAEAVKRCSLDLTPDHLGTIDDFVSAISEVRTRRGQVISLRELRYADLELIDELDKQLETINEDVCAACVTFLLRPDALQPYIARNDELAGKLEATRKVADLEPLSEAVEELSKRLDLLTDVVNNLQIADATKTTEIIDRITEVYAGVNRTRATARNLRKELGKSEAKAEFAAQFKLLSQSITNYIGMCDTTPKCDELLTKILITVEELEGRFADFEEYVEKLAEKREEAYSAFSNRKQVLDEERKRRVGSLNSSAERILRGIVSRAERFAAVAEVNAYFASDLMVAKLRDIVGKLHAMGESVKADDLAGQLKTAKDEIVRRLRDKIDLFESGADVIKFGDYKFSVNTQPLELTTVLRDGDMFFHLTGTSFYERVENPEFLDTKPLWAQEIVSESRDVYRAEYLAYKILMAAAGNRDGLSIAQLTKAEHDEKALHGLVRDFAGSLYSEGYEKGIHDHDAALILHALIGLYNTTGLLRYDATSRAYGILFWCFYENQAHKDMLRNRMRSFGALPRIFGQTGARPEYVHEIREAMDAFFAAMGRPVDGPVLTQAGEFLYHELQDADELEFTINALAHELHGRFIDFLRVQKVHKAFLADVAALDSNPRSQIDLICDWVSAYTREKEDEDALHFVWEVVALIAADKVINRDTKSVTTYVEVEDLLGQHRRIQDKVLPIHFDRFLLTMKHFTDVQVPMFERYVRLRKDLTEKRRADMRLSEFQSRVMGGFVRNKLINDVYLNLVGANFAKQMGVIGEAKRTDLMGLLLLVSPPGYGKTTLMEYLANRLGLTFMKINGPAIGHAVTSLDPAEAPNATAREELDKLNLAFEMGNNVMIYLDDIQHLNPELLQKFISLCDAQRKIEGVYRGVPRTYDLRGRKVAVVMAGNPYTESGEKFKIPDMLANRADTYNLGDISSTAAEAFEMSFIENAMTSNPVLSKVASHGHQDIYRFMETLQRGSREGVEFEHDYSAEEANEVVDVLRKLYAVRDVVLKVNKQYIYSAAQQDDYRTEPPFKMQGSYRNMNRMAEKVYPVMTDGEVQQLIIDHYYNEAQTLTTGAEANILKYREIMGILTPDQSDRWEQIKGEFNRRQTLAGIDDSDQVGKVLAQLAGMNASVGHVSHELGVGMKRLTAALTKPEDDGKIDITPVVDALQALATKDTNLQVSTAFPSEYGQALDRQSQTLENVLPILDAIQKQSASFVKLRQVLESLLAGNITVELKR